MSSNAALAEWIVTDKHDDVDYRDSVLGLFRSWTKKLRPALASGSLLSGDFPSVADKAYAIRNSVLAHGSVHSTTDLFDVVVPAFDDLIFAAAVAGYADANRMSFEAALEELALDD